jgi:hypothetical protein
MSTPNDIRKYFPSPSNANTPNNRCVSANQPTTRLQTPMLRNWRTNRRIIESDSEEIEELPDSRTPSAEITLQARGLPHAHMLITSAGEGGNAVADIGCVASHADEAAIVIRTSDSDNDIAEQPLMNTATRRAGNTDAQPRHLDIASYRTADARNDGSRPATAQRRRTRRRFEEEAEETTTTSNSDNSDNWACVESDTDAEDLYRSAIAGVRNARSSRQQLRASTTPCAICAKFAAFIQHFIQT